MKKTVRVVDSRVKPGAKLQKKRKKKKIEKEKNRLFERKKRRERERETSHTVYAIGAVSDLGIESILLTVSDSTVQVNAKCMERDGGKVLGFPVLNSTNDWGKYLSIYLSLSLSLHHFLTFS